MALTLEESAAFRTLSEKLMDSGPQDSLFDAYYEGAQRLEHIGLAVPPELRRFETMVNWPRLYVDSLLQRISVKSLILPGTDVADPGLREGWDANNLDAESGLAHLDSFVYGRGFVCVGANDEDPDHPLITVESPREVICSVDVRTRRVDAALRLYGGTDADRTPTDATLYMPDVTVWLRLSEGKWVEIDRDPHNLGRVPVVPFINRRRTGRWFGVSEMSDVVGLTDAAARALTNLQIAAETHSVPQKWVLGMTKGDFVDGSGQPIPAWQSYFSAIWANQNKDAKVGQFSASSLTNFHDTVNHYAGLVAGVTGLPMRYLGQNSANPPSADGIRADESRLIKSAEWKCGFLGDRWGDVAALYLRFRDGEWVNANQIKVEWYDAGTPTVAARADATVKLYQAGILSREGAWDDLGWSDARKDRERGYFDSEALDPVAQQILRGTVNSGADGGA